MAKKDPGFFSDAEKNLLEAHGLLVAGFGDNHERTTKAVNYLIRLYESWDAAEPGKGYYVKAAEWRARLPKDEANEDK